MSEPDAKTFWQHDSVTYVPTSPEGTLEIRREGDCLHVKRFRFIRPGVPYPNETVFEGEMRIPLNAIEAALEL